MNVVTRTLEQTNKYKALSLSGQPTKTNQLKGWVTIDLSLMVWMPSGESEAPDVQQKFVNCLQTLFGMIGR